MVPLLTMAQRTAAAVVDVLGAEGSFVAINNVVSQSVPHLHVHVVPRIKGDGLRGFFWPRTKYAEGEIETYAKLKLSAAGSTSTSPGSRRPPAVEVADPGSARRHTPRSIVFILEARIDDQEVSIGRSRWQPPASRLCNRVNPALPTADPLIRRPAVLEEVQHSPRA